MKVGLQLPQSGPLARPDLLLTAARAAAKAGFTYVALGDHLVLPREVASRHPYKGSSFAATTTDYLELLTTAAFLASATRSVRILTSVLIVPYRPPIVAAKQLATLDVLSGGRLTIGCGVGWMKEEFEALGLDSFSRRGTVTDEYLQQFFALWDSDAGDALAPRPVQRPRPPVWIGGESDRALHRAARIGDAWYPSGRSLRQPLDSPRAVSEAVRRLHQACEEVDRDPAEVGLSYECGWSARRTEGQPRRFLTGNLRERREDWLALAATGLTAAVTSLDASTAEEYLDRVAEFGDEILTDLG